MTNMSYVRFENTLRDLQDCANAIQQGELEKANRSEQIAAGELIALCAQIVDNHRDEVDEIAAKAQQHKSHRRGHSDKYDL